MKNKPYVYDQRKQPVYAAVKGFFKLFLHKPKIINLNDELPSDAIIIGPHLGKWGPYYLSLYFPKKIAFIGTHPMLGSYKERYKYLRNVMYIQKYHKGRFFSTIKAIFEAIFSKMIYKGMHTIPSYEDFRFVNTINYTQKTLDNGLPVVIYPENSENGYKLVLDELHEGFITLTKFINKRRGKETLIYPIYESVKRKQIIIGKAFTLSSLEGKNNKEICEFAKNRINELNPNFEIDKKRGTL